MRNFVVLDCEQRSEAWRQARAGRATASRGADVLDVKKDGTEGARRRDYRLQLALERITGQPQESGYVNDEMRRGTDLEPLALAAYEALTGNLAVHTGFLSHRDLMAGCSLDGHVGDFDVLVSLKCPKSATHLKNLRDARVPSDYIGQMLHELFITGAAEYHFLSFDDRFPEGLQTALVRVKRDDQAVGEYERQLVKFLAEVQNEVDAVRTLADLHGTLRSAVPA